MHDNNHIHANMSSDSPGRSSSWSLTWAWLEFYLEYGISCGSAGKETAYNAGDLGSIPGLGRSPGEGNGYPLQYSGLENSMDCVVHGVTNSWTRLSDFHSLTWCLGDWLGISLSWCTICLYFVGWLQSFLPLNSQCLTLFCHPLLAFLTPVSVLEAKRRLCCHLHQWFLSAGTVVTQQMFDNAWRCLWLSSLGEEVLLTSSGQTLWVLFNILQRIGESPATQN